MPTVHFDSSWNFKLNCTCNIEIELEIQQGDKLNLGFKNLILVFLNSGE